MIAHFVGNVMSYVPQEVVISLGFGIVLATFGLICMPATYHWDGRLPSKAGRK